MNHSSWETDIELVRQNVAQQLRRPVKEVSDEEIEAYLAQMVRRAGGGFPIQVVRDLLAFAFRFVVERICYYDPARPFEPWCYIILRRLGMQALRRSADALDHASTGRLEGQDPLPLSLQRLAEEEPDSNDALYADLLVLRELLDQIAWAPPSGQGVDYYAVLLLNMRLGIATRIVRYHRECAFDLSACGPLGPLVAWCAPWTTEEQRRCFKTGLPTLAAVWRTLEPIMGSPPYVECLCSEATRLATDDADLTPDRWYQWVRRAKQQARQRMDAADWNDYFSPWWPDQERSQAT